MEEPIMGRADVLLKFLEKISLNDPAKLDPYLDKVEISSERPITEQIVDLLLEEDPNRLKQYEDAKRDAGDENPYRSSDERREQRFDELSEFLAEWNRVEMDVRRLLLQGDSDYKGEPLTIRLLADSAPFSDTFVRAFSDLRLLRNMAIHGARPFSQDEKRLIPGLFALLKDEISVANGKMPGASGKASRRSAREVNTD